MSDIKNFNNYKNAKEAIEKFEESLAVIDVTIHSLRRFSKYTLIRDACLELKARRELIKISLDKCQKFIQTKKE